VFNLCSFFGGRWGLENKNTKLWSQKIQNFGQWDHTHHISDDGECGEIGTPPRKCLFLHQRKISQWLNNNQRALLVGGIDKTWEEILINYNDKRERKKHKPRILPTSHLSGHKTSSTGTLYCDNEPFSEKAFWTPSRSSSTFQRV
jgi:hypothetical protein